MERVELDEPYRSQILSSLETAFGHSPTQAEVDAFMEVFEKYLFENLPDEPRQQLIDFSPQ